MLTAKVNDRKYVIFIISKNYVTPVPCLRSCKAMRLIKRVLNKTEAIMEEITSTAGPSDHEIYKK